MLIKMSNSNCFVIWISHRACLFFFVSEGYVGPISVRVSEWGDAHLSSTYVTDEIR